MYNMTKTKGNSVLPKMNKIQKYTNYKRTVTPLSKRRTKTKGNSVIPKMYKSIRKCNII